MKNLTQVALVLFLTAAAAFSQHTDHALPKAETPIRLLDPKGFVHINVTTTSAEAQKYFDQGLTLAYAYNHWDALRSYRRAAELDPSMAMAWCAIADFTYVTFSGQADYAEKNKESREAIARALSLKASPKERAYIEASAARYSNAEKPDQKALDDANTAALKKIYENSPEDPDAALAYAETFGWTWTKDGKPLGETARSVEIIERALQRNPEHLGLNHAYIHAVEPSSQPERALRSADYLRSLNLKDPEFGHLVHMPAHIYIRMGDFQKAAESNQRTAIRLNSNLSKEFREWHFSHVFQFLRQSYYMQGNYEKLTANGLRSFDFVNPNPDEDRKKERGKYLNAKIWFRRWKDILDLQLSDEKPIPNQHYARAFALAATGKVGDAEDQYKKYLAECKCGPDIEKIDGIEKIEATFRQWSASKLAARIAEAKGNNIIAVEYLQKAVSIEDEFPYGEPPLATEPVRVNLGGLLLRMARYAEAEEVCRKDL